MPVRVAESSAPSLAPGQDANPEHSLLPACTLLSAGQTFAGTQNVSNSQKDEAWKVNVRVHGFDPDHGYLCGIMEALNVPYAETPVVTFWEGEIIDGKNFTFYTGKWEATPEDDVRHWSKFPSFSPLLSQVEADGGKSLNLRHYPYIFMRWKEQYFVNVSVDCGLTIAGFYYVCFSCIDGSINGFYYDPNSSPYQKLELKSTNEGPVGFQLLLIPAAVKAIVLLDLKARRRIASGWLVLMGRSEGGSQVSCSAPGTRPAWIWSGGHHGPSPPFSPLGRRPQ